MKEVNTTAAIPKAVRINGSDQPCEGASMIPKTSEVSPTIDRTAPTGSSRGAEGSVELGTINRPAMSAKITTGTLTRKTEPHQKWVNIQPPTTGPTPMPSPATPAQRPIGRPLYSDRTA